MPMPTGPCTPWLPWKPWLPCGPWSVGTVTGLKMICCPGWVMISPANIASVFKSGGWSSLGRIVMGRSRMNWSFSVA